MNRETPWVHHLLMQRAPVLMTREQFVAQYFPRYVFAYRPPSGIRLSKPRPGASHGHVIMSTAGSVKSQETKRTNRIDSAFASYLATFAEVQKLNMPKP